MSAVILTALAVTRVKDGPAACAAMIGKAFECPGRKGWRPIMLGPKTHAAMGCSSAALAAVILIIAKCARFLAWVARWRAR